MIDLETMGIYQGCAILSLGAVVFDAFSVEPMVRPNLYKPTSEHFYVTIELSSCIDIGLRIEGDTFYYWLEKSTFAREALLRGRVPIFEAFRSFTEWMRQFDVKWVWSHGAAFDCAMLRGAFYQCRLPDPWPQKCERDTRTVFDIAFGLNIPWPQHNPYVHVALYDAWTQAILIKMAFEKIRTMDISDLMVSNDEPIVTVEEVIIDEHKSQATVDV